MARRNAFYVFAKAQASAFTGGIVDYLVMILCTEFIHIHYTVSILISGITGAIVNFSINRHWTFRQVENGLSPIRRQLFRFCTVVAGSIILKSAGTYLLTTWLVIDYKISRILTDIIVSLGFNYLLQKYWVFKR